MRKRGRVDQNQRDIVDALTKCGAAVVSLAGLGDGIPDLLCCIDRQLILSEVKSKRGTLTPEQVAFHKVWPVTILRDVEDVLALVRRRRCPPSRW